MTDMQPGFGVCLCFFFFFLTSGIFHSILAEHVFHTKSRNRRKVLWKQCLFSVHMSLSKTLCACLFPLIMQASFKVSHTQPHLSPHRRAGLLPVVGVGQEKQGQRQVELRSGAWRSQRVEKQNWGWVEIRAWVNKQRHQVQTRTS